MPKTIGGIVVFEKDDPDYGSHEAVSALANVAFGDVLLKYGFQLMEEDGEKKVIPLNKDEWKKNILLVNPDFDFEFLGGCSQTGPTSCTSDYCYETYWCKRMYNPQGKYYFCGCA